MGICPNCRAAELHWDSSEDAEDIGYSVAGRIDFYHCVRCGADVEVFIPEINPYEEGQ